MVARCCASLELTLHSLLPCSGDVAQRDQIALALNFYNEENHVIPS